MAKKNDGFTAEEKAAMKQRAKELKAEANVKNAREAGLADLQAKIAEMPEPDHRMAERIHAIVTAAAPDLIAKTWYGQPAYANAEGKIICFFQPASKFGTRYSTLGFNDPAMLDEGNMWPTAFALTVLTPVEEAKISELVKKAAR